MVQTVLMSQVVNIISFMTTTIEADLWCPRMHINNSNNNECTSLFEYLLTMKWYEPNNRYCIWSIKIENVYSEVSNLEQS